MRLKQIKVAGFKTFVDPQVLSLPTQMACVSGPNGCGKSNVIDAVRWVLGESSAKNLRGDDATDVIFNGSSSRKPASRASVELIFENCEGHVQGALSVRQEISVKRVVTEDRRSDYFLNGERCRRRDIIDIFLGTGLGPRSYAIIEQGMISRLIESKPQELRVFIEEAAGISKYKERRKETESRIRSCEENLSRLQDVIVEITQTADKLERQSAQALRYKSLKTTQRNLEAELAVMAMQRITGQQERANLAKEKLKTELEEFRSANSHISLQIVELKTLVDDYQGKIDSKQEQFYASGSDISRLEQKIQHEKERHTRVSEQLLKLRGQLSQREESLGHVTSEITQLGEVDSAGFESVSKQLEEEQAVLDDLESRFADASKAWEESVGAAAGRETEKQVLESKIDALANAIARSSREIEAVKKSISEYGAGGTGLDVGGVELEVEQLSAQLEEIQSGLQQCADDGHRHESEEALLSAQLSEFKQQYADTQAKLSSLSMLQEGSAANAEALDAWFSRYDQQRMHVIESLSVKDGWGTAVEAVLTMMGSPYLVQHLPDEVAELNASWATLCTDKKRSGSLAEKVSSDGYPSLFNHIGVEGDGFPIEVNAQGVVQSAGWALYDGSSSNAGYFDRAEQLSSLEEGLALTEANLDEVEQSLAQCREAKRENQDRYSAQDNARQRVERDIAVLNSRLADEQERQSRSKQRHDELVAELANLEAEREESAAQLQECQERLDSLQGENDKHGEKENLLAEKSKLEAELNLQRQALAAIRDRHHQLQVESSKIDARSESLRYRENELQADIDDLTSEIESLTEELVSSDSEELDLLRAQHEEKMEARVGIEEELTSLRTQQSETHGKMRDLEKQLAGEGDKEQVLVSKINALDIDIERNKVHLEGHVEHLDKLDVSVKEIADQLDPEATEERWSEKLEKTQKAIGRLGAVNLASIEEYEVVKKRKDNLESQDADLRQSLEILQQAMQKIDSETRARFKETFLKINEGLSELFPKVFGGGTAELELTDDNLLTSGVAIMARPPGKKNSNIAMLSGGEKALTALSLVFSIFRLNPAPFCMLDEVDGPLDDVNVGRFCKLVTEMSESVQFLYISHNKVAMEMAKQLTGVTMREPGVSRLVSLSLEEAAKLSA